MPLVYKLIFPLRVNNAVKLAREREDFQVLKKNEREQLRYLCRIWPFGLQSQPGKFLVVIVGWFSFRLCLTKLYRRHVKTVLF